MEEWAGKDRNAHTCMKNTSFVHGTHHFLDLSLGGGFLGMRKSARIGCMSQSAEKRNVQRNKNLEARQTQTH